MPRPKRASDDVYNARRRIRRASRSAERRGETERARQLRLLAESTYAGRGAASDVARAATAALAALGRLPSSQDRRRSAERNRQLIGALRSASRGATSARAGARDLVRAIQARRNELFARQLNLASSGAESALDRPDLSGKAQARIFWMSTRRMWLDASPDRRYEEIMRRMGTGSLEEAFRRVMEFNSDAVESAIRVEAPVRDTLRDLTDERGDEPVSIGSPPEFMYMVRDAINLMR